MWILYIGLPVLGWIFGGPIWAVVWLVIALIIGVLAKK